MRFAVWVAIGAIALILAATASIAVAPGSTRRHAGVRRFSLVAVTRPSQSRRVIELSGRAPLQSGVKRIGNRLVVNGSDRDDTLIVNFSQGDPVPAGGLVYDGGGHQTPAGNVLVLRGGHFHDAVYDYSSASAGSIHLDGTSIAYRNLQPIANTGTAANIVFNLPAGDNDASLQDDGTPGNNQSELFSGNGTFETTTFANPSGSLTINGGGGGADNLTLDATDSFGNADLTIGSEGTVSADSLSTQGDLRITAGTVNQPTGSLTVGDLGTNTTGDTRIGQRSNDIGGFAGTATAAGSAVSVISKALHVTSVPASGSFAGAFGVTTSGGAIALLATSDMIELDGPLNAGSGSIGLNSGGGVLQDPAGPVTASGLSVLGGGDATGANPSGGFSLTGAANQVGTIAAVANAPLIFDDRSSLTVGDVSAVAAGDGGGADGINGAGEVDLSTTGSSLTLSEPVDVSPSATDLGTLRLVSAGGISQSPAGQLSATSLGVFAGGPVDLTTASSPGNQISAFAARDSGPGSPLSFAALGSFGVGSIPASGPFAALSGASTHNGDLTLSTPASLGLSQPVSAGTGKLTATCGTGGANCTIDASGGSLNGSPVTLAGGSGTNVFDLSDENTTGTGPLIIDGGGTGTATLVRSSVSQSSGSGLVLQNLASASVTGGNFTNNAKEGLLVQNTSNATIGGAGSGQPNVISGNGTNGVTVASGSGIQLVQNSIFANQGLGVSLQNGANGGQSAPSLSAASPSGSSTQVTGSLHSTSGHNFRIELFDNPACDGTGLTEGQTFIGSTTVTTDSSGNASFNLTVPGSSGPGDAVGATATDQATGDTSQFSTCILASPPSVSIQAPSSGVPYNRGQVVRTRFACTEGARGPGIVLCATSGSNGAFLDTRAAGPHAFTVVAISGDGRTATRTIRYTVVPPVAVSKKTLNQQTGVVTFRAAVPSAGSLKTVETMISAGQQFVAGRAQASPRRNRSLSLKITPNARGRRVARNHKQPVSLQIVLTFTPKGGTPHSTRFVLTLRAQPGQPVSSGARLRTADSAGPRSCSAASNPAACARARSRG